MRARYVRIAADRVCLELTYEEWAVLAHVAETADVRDWSASMKAAMSRSVRRLDDARAQITPAQVVGE